MNQLERVLLSEIPLTRALGLRVEQAGPNLVRLAFPLEPNHNHKQTAFGGSLYAALVTAGWSLAWCLLNEKGIKAQIVIASGRERFIRAVTSDFTAECLADAAEVELALAELASRGKARLRLKATVWCQGEACVEFDGTYALLK